MEMLDCLREVLSIIGFFTLSLYLFFQRCVANASFAISILWHPDRLWTFILEARERAEYIAQRKYDRLVLVRREAEDSMCRFVIMSSLIYFLRIVRVRHLLEYTLFLYQVCRDFCRYLHAHHSYKLAVHYNEVCRHFIRYLHAHQSYKLAIYYNDSRFGLINRYQEVASQLGVFL